MVNNDWLGFWIFLAVMCVMFAGDPDLSDAIIHFLMKD